MRRLVEKNHATVWRHQAVPEGTEIDPALLKLAKGSCRYCHGTGITGTLVDRDKQRSTLICSCVVRASVVAERRAKDAAAELASA